MKEFRDRAEAQALALAIVDTLPEPFLVGTALIGALAKQLQAQITEASSTDGLSVAVTHSTFESRLPVAA